MPLTKKAYTPAEGVYYVVPRKDGHVTILSQRSDETEEPAHMFFWEKILRHLAAEFNAPEVVSTLKTNYMGLPRGRVQQEIDTQSFKSTGRYVVLHGGDVPVNQIQYAVVQDFGLGELVSQGKVRWVVEAHEKMDPEDQKIVQSSLSKKKGVRK